MADIDPIVEDRFSPLLARLASVVLELDADGTILAADGSVHRLLGRTAVDLLYQPFADFIRVQDRPLWDLIVYRAGLNKKVGPVPVRISLPEDAEGKAEIVAIPVGGGRLQLALNPHFGALGANFAEPQPLKATQIQNSTPAHFLMLAKRLTDYGKAKNIGASEALLSVAGLNMDQNGNPHNTAKALWALHKLLSETVRDVDASLPGEDMDAEPEVSVTASPQSKAAPAQGGETQEDELQQGLAKVTKQLRETRGSGYATAGVLTVAGWDGLSESDIVRAAGYAVRKTTALHRHHSLDKLAGTVEEHVEEAKEQLRRFRQMVVQEQFDVAVQPILHLRTGAVHHHEALVRFDERFFKGSPFEMIRFAEQIGMIQDFDSAMTMKVISLIRRVRRIGVEASLAVNLSGRSIQSPVFLRNLFRILDDSYDVRKKLSFEITESSRIKDLPAVNATIQRLRRLGHKVALDDFGTGAAGLNYLQQLDVDMVKIDRQYVVRAAENYDNRAFLQSIVDMAATRGIETVGEGVDSPEARDMLRDLGFTYAQGYLFGRPAPVNEVFARADQAHDTFFVK